MKSRNVYLRFQNIHVLFDYDCYCLHSVAVTTPLDLIICILRRNVFRYVCDLYLCDAILCRYVPIGECKRLREVCGQDLAEDCASAT